ncbi:MAG: hypothetical protein ACKVUS_13760 [Saprospiraceae bacterium]
MSDNEMPTLAGCPSNILLKTTDDGGSNSYLHNIFKKDLIEPARCI